MKGVRRYEQRGTREKQKIRDRTMCRAGARQGEDERSAAGNRANQSRLGYEGVAQAGHAEVSMATTGDKSTRNIPEYRQIKPHTHMCIHLHIRAYTFCAWIPTGNSVPEKFPLRPIYAAVTCSGARVALPPGNLSFPFPLLRFLCHSHPTLCNTLFLQQSLSNIFVVLGLFSSFSCVRLLFLFLFFSSFVMYLLSLFPSLQHSTSLFVALCLSIYVYARFALRFFWRHHKGGKMRGPQINL